MEEISQSTNRISADIIDCALKVHRQLGPGLLESVYEAFLKHELEKQGHDVECQKGIAVTYREVTVPLGFRADLIVDEKVIIELKSVESLLPIHQAQLMTYLKVTGLKLGILLNFNAERLKQGIKRIVLT